jgi:DNA polymerase I-like protein with 3'-5' exonuclease and polymerase domains
MTATALKALIPSEMSPILKPLLVTDRQALSLCAAFLERTKVFGYDLETNVVDNFTERRIRTIQVGDRNEQYIIDLLAFAGSKQALVEAQGPNPTNDCLKSVKDALRPFLESKDWVKVGHNLQFEYEVVRYCLGIRAKGFFDTFRAEQQIWAGVGPHRMQSGFWALEDVVGRYTGLQMTDLESGTTFDLETPLTERQIIYAALDARLPIPVRAGQLRKLEEVRLIASVEIDFGAIPAFGDMHLHGVQTDDNAWTALIKDNLIKKSALLKKMDQIFLPVVGSKFKSKAEQDRLDELERLWRLCPNKTPDGKSEKAEYRKAFMTLRKAINDRTKPSVAEKCEGEAALKYGSPKALLKALRDLGFSKKQLPNTGDKTLEGLAKYPNLEVEDAFIGGDQLNFPIIDLLRLFRSVDKQLSTYGYAWITTKAEGGHRNPVTGRIHSNIDLFGTDTGRTSSSNPNIQNIPKEKRFRHCFTARPGYKVLTIDFNGCELRILAEMSQEPVWLDAFAKDWDVHSVGAEILFGQEWAEGAEEGCKYVALHKKCKCAVHEKLRGRVKAINFGLAYGMGPSKLAKELGITFTEAEDLLARYKAAFPTVMSFLEELGTKAKTTLEARTIIGTRRRWAKPSWETAKQRAIDDEKAKAKEEGREPRAITDRDIRWKYTGMFGSIEREGKNAPIQGTNANLSKLAMSLVWERLEPDFGAFWLNMVHDELVIECPADKADECFAFVGACMTEAGAMWIKSLPMTWEGHIEDYWTK